MIIGINAAVDPKLDDPIAALVAQAEVARQRGLALWMAQMMDLDALTALAVVGRAVPDVPLGTAVVPTYPRHPLVLASQALTVQAATGNRLTLGIGLSHRVVVEDIFGLSYAKPIRHLREYLEVLVPLLSTGRVEMRGEELRVATATPVRVGGAQAPAVLVAALGTQTLEIAGRLTDGTALWMVGPRTVASHVVPTITKAATAAGRPAPRVCVGLPVSVTADAGGARERAARTLSIYNELPSYRAMLDKEGVDGPADVAVVGDEESVATALRHLGDIGASELNLAVFGTEDERARTLDLLGSLATEQPGKAA